MLREKYSEDYKTFLSDFINYLKSTEDSSWCVDVVRTRDGIGNCLFGHLSHFCGHEENDSVSEDFDWFESAISTTYFIYEVNDGKNKKYTQVTPKLRCMAYLEDILSGEELTTWQSMEKEFEDYKKRYSNWDKDGFYE